MVQIRPLGLLGKHVKYNCLVTFSLFLYTNSGSHNTVAGYSSLISDNDTNLTMTDHQPSLPFDELL